MRGSKWERGVIGVACVMIVGAVGCKGRNGESMDSATSHGDVMRTDSAATATAPGSMAPGSTAAGSATAAPGAAGSGSAMSITGGDPEILQVLAVVDQGEVQDGQMAQRQARNAQVKSFARELVASHSQSLRQERQMAKASNVQLPTSNATGADSSTAMSSSAAGAASSGVAMQLMQQHMLMMEHVRSAQGMAFDSAFVNAQVMGHQQVLDLLQRSQGQAQNANVKNHLTEAVKVVQAHLQRGQRLQQMLSQDAGTTGDSTTKTRSDTGRRG